MKKFLFSLVLILFSHSIVNAQIKVQQSFTNDLIIIGNISSGTALNMMGSANGPKLAEHRLYCRIYKEKTTYGILVDTQNRFDDDFEFALGTNISQARESIEIIMKFMDENPLKTSMTIEDEDKRKIQLNLRTKRSISLDAIDMNGEIVCDKVLLNRANLERALKLLDNKAEEKVVKAINKNLGLQ